MVLKEGYPWIYIQHPGLICNYYFKYFSTSNKNLTESMKYMCQSKINIIWTNGCGMYHDNENRAPHGIGKERRGWFLIIAECRNISHYTNLLINFIFELLYHTV